MYKRITFEDMIRVPPQRLGKDVEEAVRESLRDRYEGEIDKDLGVVLSITEITDIGDGEIEPEDASVHYPVTCEAIAYQPEVHEVVIGEVADITEFGAFVTIGPVEGLCHISQIMDDYVSYNEEESLLTGEDGKKMLQEGDVIKARITGVSLEDEHNNKINLTMRQPGLGKLDWIIEEAEEEEGEEGDA